MPPQKLSELSGYPLNPVQVANYDTWLRRLSSNNRSWQVVDHWVPTTWGGTENKTPPPEAQLLLPMHPGHIVSYLLAQSCPSHAHHSRERSHTSPHVAQSHTPRTLSSQHASCDPRFHTPAHHTRAPKNTTSFSRHRPAAALLAL